MPAGAWVAAHFCISITSCLAAGATRNYRQMKKNLFYTVMMMAVMAVVTISFTACGGGDDDPLTDNGKESAKTYMEPCLDWGCDVSHIKTYMGSSMNLIDEQINEQINKDFAHYCTWEEMADQSVSKPVLLIIDGYDELLQASGRTYADYIKRIVEFQRRQLTTSGILVKCILTSRITLINKVEVPENSIVIKLSGFNNEQIGTWIKIWNEANHIFFTTRGISSFSLRFTGKVFELARQPLLLLLLALYDADENTLSNDDIITRTQLYERLIKKFIEREQNKYPFFASLTEP